MAGILDLEDGVRTRIFRHTVDWMQADEALKRSIQTWMVWDGSKITGSQRPDLSTMVPILRMEPTIGAMSWYSPDAQAGYLIIRLRTIIKSWNADDYLNLWEAIENSLYPYDQNSRQLLVQQQLRDLGAATGQWEFSSPAAAPDHQDEDGMFACDGMMRILCARGFRRSFNP